MVAVQARVARISQDSGCGIQARSIGLWECMDGEGQGYSPGKILKKGMGDLAGWRDWM